MGSRVLLVVLLTLAVGPAKYTNAGDTDNVKCIAKPPDRLYQLDRNHVAALQKFIDSRRQNDEVAAALPTGIAELHRFGTAVIQVKTNWKRATMTTVVLPKVTYKHISNALKLIVSQCCPPTEIEGAEKRPKDRSPTTASSTKESTDDEFKSTNDAKGKKKEKAKCDGGKVSIELPVRFGVEFLLNYNVDPYREDTSSSAGDLRGDSSRDDGPLKKRAKTRPLH
ncbi:unnamed protein product [Calypogeia fissa]